MQLNKVSLKDALYVISLVVAVAFAYGGLSTKVQAQSEAVKAIPTLALQVGRLTEQVQALKESIIDLRKEIRRN